MHEPEPTSGIISNQSDGSRPNFLSLINILDNDEPEFEPVETHTSQTAVSRSSLPPSYIPGNNNEQELESSEIITNHAVVPCSILQPSIVSSGNDVSYELSGLSQLLLQMLLKPDRTA